MDVRGVVNAIVVVLWDKNVSISDNDVKLVTEAVVVTAEQRDAGKFEHAHRATVAQS